MQDTNAHMNLTLQRVHSHQITEGRVLSQQSGRTDVKKSRALPAITIIQNLHRMSHWCDPSKADHQV